MEIEESKRMVGTCISKIDEVKKLSEGVKSNRNQATRLVETICILENFLRDQSNGAIGVIIKQKEIDQLLTLVLESQALLEQFIFYNFELHAKQFYHNHKKFLELMQKSLDFIQKFQINYSYPDLMNSTKIASDLNADLNELEKKIKPSEVITDRPMVILEREFSTQHFISNSPRTRIYEGIWSETHVALKSLIIDEELQRKYIKTFNQQKDLCFPNILKTYGFCEGNDSFWIISELAALGDIYDLIHKYKDIDLSLAAKITMLVDIATGMKYLHSQEPEILHCNLKSANLLIFQGCRIKIADFGSVRVSSTKSIAFCADKVKNELWIAPEVLFQHTRSDSDSDSDSDLDNENKSLVEQHIIFSKETDVWSFAIVIYEFIWRKLPYLGDVGETFLVLRGKRRSKLFKLKTLNEDYSGLIGLMKRCWYEVADYRPLFPEILLELEKLLEAERICNFENLEAIRRDLEEVETQLLRKDYGKHEDFPAVYRPRTLPTPSQILKSSTTPIPDQTNDTASSESKQGFIHLSFSSLVAEDEDKYQDDHKENKISHFDIEKPYSSQLPLRSFPSQEISQGSNLRWNALSTIVFFFTTILTFIKDLFGCSPPSRENSVSQENCNFDYRDLQNNSDLI